MVANYTNTFNVYMRCSGGTAAVDTGFCIASISGQSMGASAAWDGTIEAEEYVELFSFGTGTEAGRLRAIDFTDSMTYQLIEEVSRAYTDTKTGRTSVGAFVMPIDVSGSNS